MASQSRFPETETASGKDSVCKKQVGMPSAPGPAPRKVVNLMDALRRSLNAEAVPHGLATGSSLPAPSGPRRAEIREAKIKRRI
jgi:hypothetical protein